MKKFITILLLVVMCFSLVAFSGCGERFPKGHAAVIQYERHSDTAFLYNVDFEYVNSNTVKIICEDGSTMYIDSSRIVSIKVD